jgi:hypothetical protein
MKLGKRERAARRELMRWREQCRQRHEAVTNPPIDQAACTGRTRLCTDSLTPSANARPRLPAGWNSTEARRSSHLLGKVYS